MSEWRMLSDRRSHQRIDCCQPETYLHVRGANVDETVTNTECYENRNENYLNYMNPVLLPEGAVGYKSVIPWQCETFGCESGGCKRSYRKYRKTDPCEVLIHLIDCPVHNVHHYSSCISSLFRVNSHRPWVFNFSPTLNKRATTAGKLYQIAPPSPSQSCGLKAPRLAHRLCLFRVTSKAGQP